MQQRQPGQQRGLQPVGLGVLVAGGAQVGRAFRRHQNHAGATPTQPGRQQNPGIAGGFHDHHHLGWVGARRQALPEPVQLGGDGVETVTAPQQPAGVVGQLAWWAVRHAISIPSRSCTSVSFSGAGRPAPPHDGEEALPEIR
jgi:hypothetical protein